jgi:hypothetical protein
MNPQQQQMQQQQAQAAAAERNRVCFSLICEGGYALCC